GAYETRAAQIRQFLFVLALAITHDRSEHQKPRLDRPTHDAIGDLLNALLRNLAPAVVAEGVADAGEQQTQIIVNLGDRRDRRTRIARAALLLDRNRGRKAFDRVNVRLFHLLEELARIGRKRLDIAALTFRVNRVEGERRL